MYGLNKQRDFDPLMLLLGIISVIVGFLVLKWPAASLTTLAFIVGFFMVVEGIVKFSEKKVIVASGKNSTWLVISAIIDIVFGLVCFFVPGLGLMYIWILFSILFIVDSIFELWGSKFIPNDRKGYYWLTVILGVLGFILGIALLFNPMLALSTVLFLVSFYLMFFGILQIIKAF